MWRRRDLTGQVFGNLTVLGPWVRVQRGPGARGLSWLCRCTCGARVWKLGDNLVRGSVKSCCHEHMWPWRGSGNGAA